MRGLTNKQSDVLNYIQQYIDKNECSPSYREIMDHFGMSSPGSMYKLIKTLQQKGALSKEKHSRRALMPIQSTKSTLEKSDFQIPLIGNLSIGYPLELFMHSKLISVPVSLVHNPDNTYLLQVQGDALLEESIQDGDLLLIEARQDIQPGEIILGLINQIDTVLKRYYPEGQSIRLESHHSMNSSLTLRSELISIQGILVGLIRIY